MKLLRFILNVAIGVGLFFLVAFLNDKFLLELEQSQWWVFVLMVGSAIMLKILSVVVHSNILNDIFRYTLLFTIYELMLLVSDSLDFIKYDTFGKGFLLFIVSVFVLCMLVKYVILGLKSIFSFSNWKNNPGNNFFKITSGFLAGLLVLYWIGGLAECGLAGALSFLGILLGIAPSGSVDALVGSSTDDYVTYYGSENMSYTNKHDSDGNEIYRSESDGQYYKHTWSGYTKIDEPE